MNTQTRREKVMTVTITTIIACSIVWSLWGGALILKQVEEAINVVINQECGKGDLTCYLNSLKQVKEYIIYPTNYNIKAYTLEDDSIIIQFKQKKKCLRTVKGEGDSMIPTTVDGGLAVMDACFPYELLQVGDQIIYYDGEELIHHRIISRNKTHVTTKGDNNKHEDAAITKKQYKGKVIAVINK